MTRNSAERNSMKRSKYGYRCGYLFAHTAGVIVQHGPVSDSLTTNRRTNGHTDAHAPVLPARARRR